MECSFHEENERTLHFNVWKLNSSYYLTVTQNDSNGTVAITSMVVIQ